jgi:hypothetical protein
VALPSPAVAEPLPAASRWLPAETILVVEVTRPEKLLDVVFDSQVTAAVQDLPAYKKQAAEPGFQQFLGLVRYLEARLGTDWKTGMRKLLGGGITLALLPNDAVVLMVDSHDGEMLSELHEIVLTMARNDAAEKGNSERIESRQYRGATAWTFGPNEAHVIVGNRLVLSNQPEVLQRVLDLRDEPDTASLADSAFYQSAREAADPEATALLLANMEVIRQNADVQSALAGGGNPLGALVFAGVTEALREATWLALQLQVHGKTLSITADVDGSASADRGVAAFALPRQSGDGAMSIPLVPRAVAGLSLYRDLHAFYAAKDQLFPERTSGLIFFENMMGIFFSGRDLTAEVLAETQPEVRLVVAQQQYDPEIGTPQVQLPAFAAVFRLRDPEGFREVAEEAWHKALGLINFTRGQQGLPGLIIDRPTYRDTKYTAAHFATADAQDKTSLATHFNFRPTLAMLDDYLIFSSAEGLARDLIDAVRQQGQKLTEPLANTHSLVQVDGARLASLLQANRENMVRQNMIEEGHSKEQAETEIDVLLTIARHIGQLNLTVGSQQGQPQAELKVELNLP